MTTPDGVQAGSPVVVGGSSAQGPLVPGGANSGPPLALGGRQAGDPIATGWEAVQPPTGSDGGHYVHTQTQPASVITIEHNLGFRPAGVSLFSLNYGVEYAGFLVQHLSVNTVRISMDQPTACVVVLS